MNDTNNLIDNKTEQKKYASIDLKSFFASVECVERGLNPLTTNLVVADESRTEKTVCLAVSPALKAYGIGGRARLYEVVQKVKEVNANRKQKIGSKEFEGKSFNSVELKENPNLKLDFIIAVPRMSHYMNYSTRIYNTYLKYVSSEDLMSYSIDEVFCDITKYLKLYKLSAKEFVTKMIQDVYNTTGITATAGIGTNMYLAKIAMDIVAKHAEPNEFGVRMSELDEMTYRKTLWNHRPIKDFWRVGKGYANKLEKYRMYTMGDVARCSVENEELLYKLFGVNAELLIDHAWGWEPCTIEQAKKYRPSTNSHSLGQVLHQPYTFERARLIIKEMAESLSLELVEKGLITDQIVLTVVYDVENLKNPNLRKNYNGEIDQDFYGRNVPKHAHGTINLEKQTSSSKEIRESAVKLYDRIVNPNLLVRKIYIVANRVVSEVEEKEEEPFEQIDFFTNYEEKQEQEKQAKIDEEKERNLQHTVIELKKKFGKNAVLKGMNFEEGGTTIQRNGQIGGHKE